MVNTMPLNSAISAYSLPENRVITGKVVSIEVAPELAIGAILPKAFTKSGASSSDNNSRDIFDNKAITPSIES